MFICQCCFAIVKVLLKKVTYLLTYLGGLELAIWLKVVKRIKDRNRVSYYCLKSNVNPVSL